MADRPWPKPRKEFGNARIRQTYRLRPEFCEALQQYASEESQRVGRQVSQAEVLMTLCLESEPKLRKLVKDRQVP